MYDKSVLSFINFCTYVFSYVQKIERASSMPEGLILIREP